MNAHNQHVPAPLPLTQAYDKLDASRPVQRDGVVFVSENRDATGTGSHPAGSASGVYTSDIFQNPGGVGLRVFVGISTGAATGTTTVKVQVQDPATLSWWDLTGATTTALAGNTTGGVLTIHPAITVGANVGVSQCIGPTWRLVMTQALAPATVTVGADYLQ